MSPLQVKTMLGCNELECYDPFKLQSNYTKHKGYDLTCQIKG